jgi:hypothetical protein
LTIIGNYTNLVIILAATAKGTDSAAMTFRDPEGSHEVIATAGERFLPRLYGAQQEASLDDLRFSLYTKAIAKSSDISICTI